MIYRREWMDGFKEKMPPYLKQQCVISQDNNSSMRRLGAAVVVLFYSCEGMRQVLLQSTERQRHVGVMVSGVHYHDSTALSRSP